MLRIPRQWASVGRPVWLWRNLSERNQLGHFHPRLPLAFLSTSTAIASRISGSPLLERSRFTATCTGSEILFSWRPKRTRWCLEELHGRRSMTISINRLQRSRCKRLSKALHHFNCWSVHQSSGWEGGNSRRQCCCRRFFQCGLPYGLEIGMCPRNFGVAWT